MHQTVTFEASYWVKLWKWTAYNKIIQNFENGGRIFTHSPNHLHANLFQNVTKCTYFYPKTYLRGQKMYLVNNVLENQIWAVPLLRPLSAASSLSLINMTWPGCRLTLLQTSRWYYTDICEAINMKYNTMARLCGRAEDSPRPGWNKRDL